MATNTTAVQLFTSGQESSASSFMKALQSIQGIGTSTLSTIENANTNILVEFDIRLQAVNARRVRAWRVLSSQQAVKLVASDFTDIDQVNTVATVRADSSSITLKERSTPAEAIIQSNTFSVNEGSIETLNSDQTLFTVTTTGNAPVGQFNIQLLNQLTINQLFIDIIASPSSPNIVISTSTDGVSYTKATNVSVNGYVVTAWLPSLPVKYIQMQVTPSHPDNLSGNSFSFGITSLSAQATTYQLRSDFLTNAISFNPNSEQIVLSAESDPNIQYYLSVYTTGGTQTPLVEINPGDAVQIGTKTTTTITTSIGNPTVLANVPSNLYLNTVSVSENGVSIPTRIASGLSSSDPNISRLQHEYVIVIPTSLGYQIKLLSASGNYTPPRTFSLSYVCGPVSVTVQLKVRLSTANESITPIFTGASLDSL